MTPLVPEDDRFTIATKHWHRLDDGRIQCDVCPRACKLHEGQRGLCFVRGRIDDQVKLTSYGRSSGFCVDPVEKKPLNHFLPGSAVLSFGTAGCNTPASFARTPGISLSLATSIPWPAGPLQATSPALLTNWVVVVWHSPTTIRRSSSGDHRRCRRCVPRRGIKAVAVTAGYMCAEPRAGVFGTSTPPTST